MFTSVGFRARVYLGAATGLTVAGLAVPPAKAAPYASGISESGGSVSYYLNESGANVTVIRDGVPEDLGAHSAGLHSFPRNGAGSYEIRVTKNAGPGYAQISTNTTFNNFELPRGVAVNTNPGAGGAPNPLFGRVYVSNGRESNTVSGRVMTSGIYVLNSDFSEVASARTGGVAWLPAANDSGGVSPFRLQVGPDNRLYVTDWSDSHSGLWSLDGDANNGVEVLDSTGRDAAGLNGVHGSISDVVIRGTGANRRIYTVDEDFPNSASSQRNSILRYDIGTTPTFTGSPTVFYDDAANGNVLINSQNSLARADDGTWWVSQIRNPASTDTGLAQPSLVQISADGSDVLWTSLELAPNGDSITDPLRNAQGIAFDSVNDVIAIVTGRNITGQGQGLIQILDADTQEIVGSLFFGTSSSTTNVDVAFDAVGNLYVTNRSAERLHVWSPGGNTIATTFSDGSFTFVPEPGGAVGLLAVGGLVIGRRRPRRT